MKLKSLAIALGSCQCASTAPGMRLRLLALVSVLALPSCALAREIPESPPAIATEILAPLLDPVKVPTLKGDRPANTRLYKVL